ncbi:hypothetical protein WR25_01562 isoform B [Diploscapter pachys]|uniref:Vps16 C-terminal domain-containing protein n=1 Tax=Diploscapter pachys TaxID=2018661 RepID=A0A2A2K5R6_9BILA|nr:hypothetical protein WR25_01562 isoform A [Diploscapter pachys]PAV69222.1 hypothetical protein WR25_01562 isoform B [Diploscapter pachys]
MYHGKKKFTFDDPEDSYWNESGNGSTASSLFDDLPSKQWAARIAVDNLFDTKDNTQPPPLTHPTTTAPQTQQAAAADRTQINFASAPPLSREKLVDNFLHSRAAAGRGVSGMSMSPERALPGAPSVTSECSASSLPSEAQRLDLDYSRLRAEHRKLQKHLEMELLDSAIDHVDSQVIQPVVLFLKRTLSDSIFRSILLEKKEVAEEYITHLKRHKDYAELATTLFCLGRNADAAMIEYAAALKTKMPEQKVNALRNVCRTAFSDPQLAHEAGLVSQHASLLEMQIAIQAGDAQSKSDIFKQFPRNAPLVGQSAIATLYYCSLYHYDLPMTSQANPQKIRDFLGISEKEFRWTAASALTRQSRWPDIERLLQPKGVMGAIQQKALQANTKLVCPFSWNNLFYVLHSNTSLPPKDLLCRILRSVSDQELRLKLAEKYQVPEVVIECLVAQRDRVRLKIYTDKLTPHTPDYYKSIAALNNAVRQCFSFLI